MRPAGSPTMVGRSEQLRVLLDALDDSRAGRPRALLVRGEAGIGKTRLINELLTRAAVLRDADLPLAIAVGQCVDLGPIGAPFGPIRRVLRDLHAEVGTDELRAAAGSPAVVNALSALVPGLAESTGDEHAGEFAESIEVLLDGLSQRHHVVIVIEDLQWADAATFGLLKTVAATLRGRHLLLVATYRSDDIDRFHPLHPVLAELDRTRGLVRVDLEPLSAAEVGEQIANLRTADDVDPLDVDMLAERSGGIPFLVEELVDLGECALPETLRDLVLARYTRLSEPTQEVVRAMAAGGMHVDHDALAAVSALDERALDRAVREAIDSRVVVADGAGYSFRHALTQEAVHSEMLPSERVRVHRALAEHLSANRPADSPDDVSAVAEHWLAARDIGAAFDATVTALHLSRATYAPATSVKLAERLTELWHQVPDASARAATTLPALHLEVANAWHQLGDSARSLRSSQEGLAVCPDDPVTRAALLRARFVEVFNSEHRTRSEDLAEAAALLEPLDDPAARGLLARVLANLTITTSGDEAREYSERAIALAEDVGDDASLAVALVAEAWRRSESDDDEPAGLVPLERAMTLRLDPPVRAYVAAALVEMLARVGRFGEAITLGVTAHAETVRAGIERGSGTSIAYSLVWALLSDGRADEALAYAARAKRLSDRTGRATVDRFLLSHLAWNDQPDEGESLYAADKALIDESVRSLAEKSGWWALWRAEALLDLSTSASGIPAALAAELRAALDADAPLLRRFTTIAVALLVARDREVPADLAPESLLAAVDTWPHSGAASAHADFVRATLDTEADAAERARRWRTLADDDRLIVWHRAVARLFLAEALIASGDREAAGLEFDRLVAEAPAQGLARVARWARDAATRAGLSGGGASEALPALTPRETQVLELIAEGLTNAEIGKRLFISPKTASVHVSAILAKVGAANRAEAAARFAGRL